jgi:hypothetical protein
MNMRFDAALATGTMTFHEDAEEPVSAWRLDELDQLSDLESVRSAWGRTDDTSD